ncbi:MAG: GldG family protein [Actinomycetota bacterium]|nr:GldG family protein [Actinomycetota bacterium]
MPAHPKLARVLFDESHSEAWTIDAGLAREMQPAHPEDSSLELAAAALSRADFDVASHTSGPLDKDALAEADVLVIAHPSDPRWEATVPGGSPLLAPEEIDAIERWVSGGGGLIVLGETENDKYGNNLNVLLERFGIQIETATVQDYEHHRQAPSWVLAELDSPERPPPGADPLTRVEALCFYRAGTLALSNGARSLARTHASASSPNAPLAAISEHGSGRVAVTSDSDLFGDDCFGDLDHEALWLNLAYWVGAGAFKAAEDTTPDPLATEPDWLELKAAVSELRLRQEPDGSVDTAAEDAARLRDLVDTIARATQRLKPHFPHQHDYIDAVGSDLVGWADSGFAKPDFARSTEAFRPDLWREDGIRHLVVFPMYKQNASRDVAFEALLVRVPWPEWVQELESSCYDNPKFVPVELLDNTEGYDSECAVLFPETFSYAEKPAEFHFGAIFCDREAERFRRVGSAAADALRLNLPPDAAALLTSPELSRDAYILWDLIHDRTHMRGDLPFDPFMIRQRSPYWMYSLEELRCDLTAFSEAVKLEREEFAFARHVQYAILFDRLFRFPLTGTRVRNYDGLGGQLLFAFLHREGYAHWSDNRMVIDWDNVAEGVESLRERVQELYHSGIDRSKLGQWTAAHDLVSEYVPPAESSVWARERRALPEVDEPKELVDLVRNDEFPLSLFFSQLAPKLAPALERPFAPTPAVEKSAVASTS